MLCGPRVRIEMSQDVRRPLSPQGERGKSELRRAVRRVTPGQGNLKESGTENIPPNFALRASLGRPARLARRSSLEAVKASGERRRVRVKRCGKSAPRSWQHEWQAKPRTEQDQIGGLPSIGGADGPSVEPPGRSLDPASDGRARGMVATLGPSPEGLARKNRIRLMASCDAFGVQQRSSVTIARASEAKPLTRRSGAGWCLPSWIRVRVQSRIGASAADLTFAFRSHVGAS